MAVFYPFSIRLLSVFYPSSIHLLSVFYLSSTHLLSIFYLSSIYLLSIFYLSSIYLLSIFYLSSIPTGDSQRSLPSLLAITKETRAGFPWRRCLIMLELKTTKDCTTIKPWPGRLYVVGGHHPTLRPMAAKEESLLPSWLLSTGLNVEVLIK